MICIDNTHTDAFFNLAAEEYMLKNFSDDVFMLWQNESSVIIGKHQDIRAEVNLEFARANSVKVARRYSGGGAVYHDAGNLNLTFIESNSKPNFGKFTQKILEILESIGIQAQSDERQSIYIDGMKISGCAQFILKDKVMFHASLLFSTNLSHLSQILNCTHSVIENGKRYVKSVKSPVTNISDHLSNPLQLSDFKRIIWNNLLENQEGNSPYSFSNGDVAAITKLKKEKYATTNWNYNA
ncbi:MAG TPA: lipoate--protein ligase family protein [Bacteroidales bacterium]|nr:lipoate--protein ligase family protein [Bacteroidales bacterium]